MLENGDFEIPASLSKPSVAESTAINVLSVVAKCACSASASQDMLSCCYVSYQQ